MNCKVVAEIGTVHLGNVDRARDLIKLATICGADYVKFQKRNPIESTPQHLKNSPHPNPDFSYGRTYLEHRLNLELNIDDHIELANYCSNLGIGYATSVWDVTSAQEIVGCINPDYIKIPSACNQHFELLYYVYQNFTKSVHISTGMVTRDELQNLINVVNYDLHGLNRTVFYHCTSEYPCSFEHLYLLNISSLKQSTKCCVGFSNHGYGIAADIAAAMLGAEWIERHFVDDRTLKHSDASASLEPDGLRRLCRDLKNVAKSLTFKEGLSQLEMEQKLKLVAGKQIS